MDKPTTEGWYEATDDVAGNRDCYWWTGTKLLPRPEYVGVEIDAGRLANYRRLVEVPAPEVIIGDGATVLRPGVWASRWIAHKQYGRAWSAFVNLYDTPTIEEREYQRIGDVPGEASPKS